MFDLLSTESIEGTLGRIGYLFEKPFVLSTELEALGLVWEHVCLTLLSSRELARVLQLRRVGST